MLGSITPSEFAEAASAAFPPPLMAMIAAATAASSKPPPSNRRTPPRGARAAPTASRRAGRRGDRGILHEDRALELLKLGPGLEAQLSVERPPRIAVAVEGRCLAARAVEREHQLGAQTLPRWMPCDEALELGNEHGVPAEREIRLDPVLQDGEAQLLEPADLPPRELLIREIGQRLPSPELQRRPQALRRLTRFAAVERLAPLRREPLEAVDIHLIGAGEQRVAAAARYEHAFAEHLAKTRYVDPDRLLRRLGRPLTPELVDYAIDGDGFAPVQQEDREDGSLTRSPQGRLPSLDQGLDRPQEPELHQRSSVRGEPTARLLVCNLQQPRVSPARRGSPQWIALERSPLGEELS